MCPLVIVVWEGAQTLPVAWVSLYSRTAKFGEEESDGDPTLPTNPPLTGLGQGGCCLWHCVATRGGA